MRTRRRAGSTKMTDTIAAPPGAAPPAEPPRVAHQATHFRPAAPDVGRVGRSLRRVIGMDEDLLDNVPEERGRYTRMAAIVVATGVMAMLSASVFLGSAGASILLVIPIACFWGLLVLCLDSWLITSTHGVTGSGKLWLFFPRLVISLLIGLVIAEPLLLFLFGPSIETEARDTRLATIGQYESHLRDCNPLDGSAPKAVGCSEEFILNVPGSPLPLIAQKETIESRRASLKSNVDASNDELKRREELARSECNGTKTPETTGVYGVGVDCRRNRAEADGYRKDYNQDANVATLTALGTAIDEINTRIGVAAVTYSTEVSNRIKAQVDAKRNNQSSVGILDEHAALEALTERSVFVSVLSWLVRILLVVIDCLPVLTKMLSGHTTYDSLLRRQLDMDNRVHERRTAERENRDVGNLGLSIKRDEQRVRHQINDIESARQSGEAARDRELDARIEELAATLRGGEDPRRR